jgi:Ca2+-binding EF-hand superfamily protein
MPLPTRIEQILTQLSNHLEKHYDGLRSAFLNVDSDQNGWISKEEFGAVFKVFNFPISSEDLNELIDAFDSNKDGKVSYLEFCNVMINGPWAPMSIKEAPIATPSVPVNAGPMPDEVKLGQLLTSLQRAIEQKYTSVQDAFMHLDVNRSGLISAQELIGVLHNHNIRVSWDDIQLLVDYFDTNRDGLVSWSEFCKGIQMNKWNPRGAGDNRGARQPVPVVPHGQSRAEAAPSVINSLHTELKKYMSSRYETNKAGFLAINTSRSGAITVPELGLILAKASDSVPTQEAVAQLFQAYDLNGDGVIQFSEYVKSQNKTVLE